MSQQQQSTKQLLCRYYQRGDCRFGSSCQFGHDDSCVPIPDEYCVYYLQSRCMYGQACRFLHSPINTIISDSLSSPELPLSSHSHSLSHSDLTSHSSCITPSIPPSSQSIIPCDANFPLPSLSLPIPSSQAQLHPLLQLEQAEAKPLPLPSSSSLASDSRQSSEDSGFCESSCSSVALNCDSTSSVLCLPQSSSSSASYVTLSSPNTNQAQAHQFENRTYAQVAQHPDTHHDDVHNNHVPKIEEQRKQVEDQVIEEHIQSVSHKFASTHVSMLELSRLQLCPYAIGSMSGKCPYNESPYSPLSSQMPSKVHLHGGVRYLDGDFCDLCGRAVVHPYNEQQKKDHREECIKEHEKEMELSFAIQRSIEKTCGVCMDVVMEKEPASERRFGILEKCNHVFCLTCIRKWRQTKQFDNRTIRACPECRCSSDFVIPSKYWYDDKQDKDQLIDSYKRALSSKPCKYFKQGQGECPFAGACFYLHAYPDGRKAEMAPPRQRRRQNQDGELETLRDMLLWNYLEVRDMSEEHRWLFTLDLEEMIDASLFSETDDDDSDLSDYADNDIVLS